MRMVIAGLALAMAVPASAQPVMTEPLAAGEVLLELNATGTVTSRADLATLSLEVSAQGSNEAEARAALAARISRLTRIARAAGVTAADIEVGDVSTTTTDPNMMMAMDDAMPDDGTTAQPPEPAEPVLVTNARSSIELRVRNVDRVGALTEQIGTDGVFVIPIPAYTLVATEGPRRTARSQALASARADAEAYAAAIDMRVLRVVRVTERVGFDFLSMMMSERSMQRAMGMSANSGPDIETTIILGVDFALGPR